MRRASFRACVLILVLTSSMVLLSCGGGHRGDQAATVAFAALVANPRQYSGLTVCTEGVYLSGCEASGLAAALVDQDGPPQLAEPVIWLEGADVQSHQDCILTDTQPPFEFCRAVVCGLFETGAGNGHGGGYAFQLRGSGVSAQPAPTATLAPVPSARPSAAPLVEPPPAHVQIDGREQVSGIGSYCWQQATGTDTGVGVCADMAGIPTAREPLVVCSPFAAHFRLAPEEAPDELLLEVIPVTAADELAQWPAGWRGWTFKQGERFRMPLEREPSLDLSLDPGLYVLSLAGWWQAWGDASYGFLLEVQPPLAALVVDESPIVAAGLDGPGHFEYTDRLGDQHLTWIKGLRAFSAGQELSRRNAALAPFGYRLEAHFDADWNRTFHDLYHEGQAEPVLAGLSHVWPVSADASGTAFAFVAENAPNVSPLYLEVQAGRVEPWDADQTAFLPPVFVGDALARVTFSGFPTLTYRVELDEQPVYSGTATARGAYMPLRSVTAWDGHWVLEVDDYLIQDGQDLGQALGCDAAFGFTLVGGRPFYFFEQGSRVRIAYDGRALPNAYDRVFHNQRCEAAIHNVETLGDAVLFHALWNGTWYLVEAGVYDGEMAGTYRYAIRSRLKASETLLRSTVLFDGQRRYEFHAALPPVAEEEYQAILHSFRPSLP